MTLCFDYIIDTDSKSMELNIRLFGEGVDNDLTLTTVSSQERTQRPSISDNIRI